MAEMTDAEFQRAEQAWRDMAARTPLASSARYDRASGRVLVELTNGCGFAFPPRLAQGLEHATDEQLAAIEVSPGGYGLHWPLLDADFSVPGLMAGRFGTARYMAERFGRGQDAQAAE